MTRLGRRMGQTRNIKNHDEASELVYTETIEGRQIASEAYHSLLIQLSEI